MRREVYDTGDADPPAFPDQVMTSNKCPERVSGPLYLATPLTDYVPRTIGVHTNNSELFSRRPYPDVSLEAEGLRDLSAIRALAPRPTCRLVE